MPFEGLSAGYSCITSRGAKATTPRTRSLLLRLARGTQNFCLKSGCAPAALNSRARLTNRGAGSAASCSKHMIPLVAHVVDLWGKLWGNTKRPEGRLVSHRFYGGVDGTRTRGLCRDRAAF